ncbi:hypothetical protein BGX31_009279 [Mortierella sp. GBA43]|nr:hypothetical protein BGX31_009279 [Mortierella sp. GBA43]
MVKLLYTITAMATMVASVASAAPFGNNPMRSFSSHMGSNDCVPEAGLKEISLKDECLSDMSVYRAFWAFNLDTGSFLSKHPNSNLVMSSGPKPLVFCAAYGDTPCIHHVSKICVRENRDYYIRAEIDDDAYGFLAVDQRDNVRIVPLREASKFYMFQVEDGRGQVKIGYRSTDGGDDLVLAAKDVVLPVSLEKPAKSDSQEFKFRLR